MNLTLDDTGSVTKMVIENNGKVLLKKKGTIKKLLKFVFDGTKKQNVKDSIMSLKSALPFMIGGVTKIEIKG